MNLTPAQSLIATDTHRYKVVNAGRRFGKSTLIAWDMLGMAMAHEDARVPYYAPTRDDARDIMWNMLKKVAEPAIVDTNEGRLEITVQNVFGGTSRILLYGWEAVQERGKGVGVKNNHIYLDEVAKYRNFSKGWQEILYPTLTDLAGGATFISTPNGFNHFYDLYMLEKGDPEYKSFHFTSYDNPWLPEGEVDKAKSRMTEDRFAQEYMADFRKMEGLVYKEFDRERHVVEPQASDTNLWVEKIVGVDFGFTNPCAVITICRDSSDNYVVTDEFYERGRTDTEVAEYVSKLGANRVYPDPEAAAAIEQLRRYRVNVREVIKGKDSIKNGIDSVRELFKANKLKIAVNCTNLIQELETYSYPDRKPNHNEYEDPIKENDHALDALRYAIMMATKNTRTQAHVRYAPSAQPHPTQPTAPELQGVIPKYATTYIPRY